MLDMRPNLAIAIIVAIGGAAFLRSMKPPIATDSLRRWIPAIAFIAGPLTTVGWYVIDICFVSSFTHPDDIVPSIVELASVGVVAGAIGAAALWLVQRCQPDSQMRDNSSHSEHPSVE